MNQSEELEQLLDAGNGFQALKGIDLTVPEGDSYALLGPNGAGKSTTISIISSLTKKTSGSVEIFGHNLDSHPSHAKQCLGVVEGIFNRRIIGGQFGICTCLDDFDTTSFKTTQHEIFKLSGK